MPARLAFVALISIAAAARIAHAEQDADATRKLLDEQVRAINAADAQAFAATLAGDAMAILPAAADEGVGTTEIEAAAKRWFAASGKLAVKLAQPRISGGVFDAELAAGTQRWRVSGLAIQTTIEKKGEISEGPFKIVALHISEAADDKVVLAAAGDGKLPTLPKLAAADYTNNDLDPAKIAGYAKHVQESAKVSLIGSSAKEHAVGHAAVAKLLGGWRSLKLATQSYRAGRDPQMMWGLEWGIGHVEATFTVKGKPVKVPYRALVIVSTPSAVGADHGAATELVSAHYSVATR